ncbi:MAG: DUF3108 domain-containing protein [Gammaproteobacteria bacterium]|nr:DUF3108 domain-containing protein [Gammaproteobacteria bacterium]
MKNVKIITLLFVVFFSHTLFAAHALPQFSAQYAIQKFGIKLAEAHYQLSYTDTGYKFTQNTQLHGVASLFANDTISTISFVDTIGDNLLLTKHSFVQTGREKNRDEDINILWNTYKNSLKGEITGIVRSKKINLKTDTEVWDVLSFQIPLMIEANKDIKEYPYKAILKGEINTYNFVLTASKKISFAGKDYQSLQMVRIDPHKNRQLHIWLIPELYNIPVIIENYRDGKEHSRMQLESVQFNNKKPLIEQLADDDDF